MTPQCLSSSLSETHSGHHLVQVGLQCHSCHLCSITQPICSSRVVLTPLYTICWMGKFQRSFCTRELIGGKSAWGRPHLHFNYICRKDMRAMDMDIKRWKDVANNTGDLIYTNGWNKARRNGGLPLERSMLDGKKTTSQHQGRSSSPAFFVVKNATPVWACTIISSWGIILWAQISQDWPMPQIGFKFNIE